MPWSQQALNHESARVGETDLSGYDIEMSADWRTVTAFQAKVDSDGNEKWTSTKFCLNGDIYQSCGEDSNSAPPQHGLLPQLP
jgi:hypothetical protein